MKITLQFTVSEERRALPILLRHSPGMILPNRTYVLADEAVAALKAAGMTFTELGREADAPTLEGADLGERI